MSALGALFIMILCCRKWQAVSPSAWRGILRARIRKGGDPMTVMDMITLICFAVTLFIAGYTIGKKK